MTIKRLDIGLWRKPNGSIKWDTEISYDKGSCGCHIWTLGPICVTWLSNECSQSEIEL